MRGHLAALLAGVTLLIPAGCGSSDEQGEPLPQDAVTAISARLDEVQRRYEDGTSNGNRGACDDIEEDSYRAIDDTVEDLPADIDRDVREALEASLVRLQELTREGCSNVEEKEPEPETTPTETVPETTVPEETAPEQTDTEETTPEPDPKGKDKDKQKGNNGNGNTTAPGGTTVPPGNNGGQLAPEAEDE